MTNRIDHTGHNHPATPAARAECRKAMIQVDSVVIVKLSDAPEQLATVTWVYGDGRYDVRLTNGFRTMVYTSAIRKA